MAAETTPTAPINPYGTSKLMSEWMLRDLAAARALRYVALRYFNVAGSDTGGRIGQATPGATLLIKVASEAASASGPTSASSAPTTRPPMAPASATTSTSRISPGRTWRRWTPARGRPSAVLNCGYGHGYSVREVLDSVQRVAGSKLIIREEPRRAGDPAVLVAKADRIRSCWGGARSWMTWTPSCARWTGRQLQRNPW